MNDITFRNIEYFQKAVQSGNISKAAESLYITQQSLSRHISKIEEILQVELFNRNGNKLELTESGRIFYEKTCVLMEYWSQIIDDTRKAAGDGRDTVHIGIIHGMESYFMPKIFSDIKPRFPQFDIITSVLSGGKSIFDYVKSGAFDIAIALTVSDDELQGVNAVYLRDCSMKLAISRDALNKYFDEPEDEIVRKLSIYGSRYVFDRCPLLVMESQSDDEIFPIGSTYTNNDIAMLNCINGLGVTFCPDFMEEILQDSARKLGKELVFLQHNRPDVATGRLYLCSNKKAHNSKSLKPLLSAMAKALK